MVSITSKRFSPRPTGLTEVKVYSNCDSVSLVVNGKSLGTKWGLEKKFVWSGVELSKRLNDIEAIGYKGKKRVKDACTWLTSSKGPPSDTPLIHE